MESELARKKILAAIKAVKPGDVCSYGEIARRAGLPGRARMVAWALRHNDDPKLPWFRIMLSSGRIAMPEGSKGAREQAQRLRAEGRIVENGRVKDFPKFGTLDAQLWAPPDD